MEELQPPDCIHRNNPFGGFGPSHSIWCCSCGAVVTHHVYLEYWCGNVCVKCSKLKTYKRPATVVPHVFVQPQDRALLI